MSDIERVLRHVDPFVLGDGCWEWQGQKTEDGYGRCWLDGRMQRVHRWVWEQVTGAPIAEGLVVCHRCDNPSCVRPSHLFIGTQRDNVRDAMAKGRHHQPSTSGRKHRPDPTFTGRARATCRRGHPLTAENLIITHNGARGVARRCRTCRLARGDRSHRPETTAAPVLAH